MANICAKGDPEDFSNSFMYSVHQMNFLVSKHLEQTLSKAGALTFSQFMILVGFKCPHSGDVSQQTIAQTLDLTEATVSRHVATLVAQGYVYRKEDESNRRKHILSITTKGDNAFNKAKKIINGELDSLFSIIPVSERQKTITTFNDILLQLQSMNKN